MTPTIVMQKITTVLAPEQLADKTLVKTYLEKSFRRRRTEKDKKLYININIIFTRYPEIIKSIIRDIPILGYYKDYFHILAYSRNAVLDKYIYDIVVSSIKKDYYAMREHKEITTLGKWLPREGSKIDRKCDFVDKFNVLFYPRKVEPATSRRWYRKMKTAFNVRLGTIEAKLCTKQLGRIEYEKVSPFALKKYNNKLLSHEESKDKYEAFTIDKLSKMSLNDVMKEIIRAGHSAELVEKVWNQNTFRRTLHLDKIISDAACLLDLSGDTYKTNNAYFAVGIALLVDQHSTLANKVIVGRDTLNLQGSVLAKSEHIMRHVGPCDINLLQKQIDALHDQGVNNVILVTPKQIPREENITHFKTVDNGFYIFLKGRSAPISKYLPAPHNGVTKRNIKFHTNNSHELLDKKTPIAFLCFVVFVLFVVAIMDPSCEFI